MTTLEDLRRMADALGHRELAALITRATAPRIPADLLKDCERAAGIATACTEKEPRT